MFATLLASSWREKKREKIYTLTEASDIKMQAVNTSIIGVKCKTVSGTPSFQCPEAQAAKPKNPCSGIQDHSHWAKRDFISAK